MEIICHHATRGCCDWDGGGREGPQDGAVVGDSSPSSPCCFRFLWGCWLNGDMWLLHWRLPHAGIGKRNIDWSVISTSPHMREKRESVIAIVLFMPAHPWPLVFCFLFFFLLQWNPVEGRRGTGLFPACMLPYWSISHFSCVCAANSQA